VKKFEQEVLRFMRDSKADVMKELGDKKALTMNSSEDDCGPGSIQKGLSGIILFDIKE